MHVREHALRGHVCVGGLRRVRMSKAGGVSNVEVSTNREKTCRMMSYHAVVRISYLVGRGSFRRKWMGGATAVLQLVFRNIKQRSDNDLAFKNNSLYPCVLKKIKKKHTLIHYIHNAGK